MKSLVRLGEKILVVVGFLYLTESLFAILPGALWSPVQYGMYVLVFLLLLARGARTIKFALRDPFICLLLILAVFSTIWSEFPSDTLRNSIVAFQTVSFGLYVASCYTLKQQIRLLAIAMGIAAILSFLYSLALPGLAIHSDGSHAGAWRGIYSHKNVLAQVSTYSSLIFLFLTQTIEHRYRSIAWVGLVLCVSLILLSTSKTALMVWCSLLILFQLYKASRWRNTKMILILIIILLIFATLVILLVSNAEAVFNSLGRDITLTGRTEIWAYAVERIKERPLLGYGRDAFWHPLSSVAIKIEDGMGGVYAPPHSHNGFVDLTCDLGLIGLSLFLLSFFLAFGRAYNLVRFTRTPEYIWPIMYLSFFLLYNLTESSIMKHNSAYWASYIAVVFSIKLRQHEINAVDKMRKTINISRNKKLILE